MTTKLLASFFYTMLGGKILMQIPEVTDYIQIDRINGTVYNVIFGITFSLWALKFILVLYERKRKNDLEHYEKKKDIDQRFK